PLKPLSWHETLVLFCLNRPSITVLYTLSLHDALPIYPKPFVQRIVLVDEKRVLAGDPGGAFDLRHDRRKITDDGSSRHAAVESRDRKSTRLNSSHVKISYAVFCLKKKSYSEPATSAGA